MSEAKFVVGQWVTWHERTYRVEQIDEAACGVRVNSGAVGAVSMWIPSYECFPFVWQVGKTYRTTLDGVTATIDRVSCDRVWVACKWHRAGDPIYARNFHQSTGKLCGFEDRDDVPHLLPYLADEPPPVAEAATYSEFEDADECDKELNALEAMLDEFVAERMACEVELRTSRDLVSRWESRIDAWQHAEKIAREKIERAKR